MNALEIANTSIRQDSEGRYCLNDLHKASGGESKHQPSNFMRLDSTCALMNAINRSSDVMSAISIAGGANQGTYVVKQLVYAYAMWISADFSLKVINTFDAVATGQISQPAFAIPSNLSEALRLAADNIEARERAESQLAIAVPKAQALDLICDAKGLFGVREAAKTLKITQSELTTLLVDRQWMYRDGRNVLQGYANRIEQGYVKHQMSAPIQDKIGVDHVYSSAKITAKGMTRLAQILAKVAA